MAIKLINASTAGIGVVTRQIPASNTHYLKNLGKLELTGIPQITYKPLTCNDNSDRIVPGIFKHPTSLDLRVGEFIDPTFSYFHADIDPTFTGFYTNIKGLDHEAVFAENDFKCCTPLGKKNADATKCCSGYGKTSGTSFTCVLPDGADLMVYFNRFVSNEGRGTDQPGGGLVDADFNKMTGEPIVSTTVSQKISLLGTKYCESTKVRQGGAFGSFGLEPEGTDTNQNEKNYGIVDSSQDEGQLTTGNIPVGYSSFMAGFRWNHHLYCDE